MSYFTADLMLKGLAEVPDPNPPPPPATGLALIAHYMTGYQAEKVSRMYVVDYPRQAPSPIWNEILSLDVPDIRKGDVIFAWGQMQATNNLPYCVEFTGGLWLSPLSGNFQTGTRMCHDSGYNLTPQIFDYPYDNGAIGEFPGMHHGLHQRHGRFVATEDIGTRRVVYTAYAGGSSHTTSGDYLVVDKYGDIMVQHFRPMAA